MIANFYSFIYFRQQYLGITRNVKLKSIYEYLHTFNTPCKPLWKEQLSIELNFPQILKDMIDDELFC